MANRDMSADVVIVGSGIAGGALAAVLARANLDVLLLEKSETYADRVRGEAVVQWGVAEAERLGLLPALLDAGGHFVRRSIGYDEIAPVEEVEAAPLDMDQFLPGVPGILAIAHPRHCQALMDAAAAAGANVRRGVRIESATAGAAPRVTFEAGGETLDVRARIIVGADGRPSAMREALGVPLEMTPPRNRMAGLLIEGADDWDAGVWVLGAEGDLCFAVFPQGGGRARLYGWWPVAQGHRFTGADGVSEFLAAFNLACCPASRILASARPAGPLLSFLNNETWTATPFVDGAVLIGDAAGWTDPLIGCGLSSAYRDARVVSEILLASDNWSPTAFAPYAEERAERLRRLRFVSDLTTGFFCEFGEVGRSRRRRFAEQSPTEPALLSHLIANLVGPESQPAEIYTPAHRAWVLDAGSGSAAQ
jgi:2-polyprenyl-6-methoxyphenol hydroxylase-like FAD-dependent oxidoreductase